MPGRILAAAVLALALFTTAVSVQAQSPVEGVRATGWSPELGKRQTWRIDISSGTQTVGGVAGLRDREAGTLVQHMTVLGRTLEGYSVLWELDRPDGPSFHEEALRSVSALYGISQLVTGTDTAGVPQQVYGIEAIRARLAENMQLVPPEAAKSVQVLLQTLKSNPHFEMHMLSPVAGYLGRVQRAAASTVITGDKFVLRHTDQLFNGLVTGDVEMIVESVSPSERTYTITWVWDIPDEAIPETMRHGIAEALKRDSSNTGFLPGPLREQASSFSNRYEGRAMISLDDGSAIKFEEARTMRIGLEAYVMKINAERQ